MVDALISGYDYAPTILSLAGREVPEYMDGVSFWPVVDGQAEAIHGELFIGVGGYGAIRTRDWHYFAGVWDAAGRPQAADVSPHLYDLSRDREETANAAERHPDVVRELGRRLRERFAQK